MTNYDTSIPLKSRWFELIQLREKTIEVRRDRRGIQRGATVRFMRGYDPSNGTAFRKVVKVKRTNPSQVSDDELEGACVSREWLEAYADRGRVYLLFLGEANNKCQKREEEGLWPSIS